MFTKLQQNIGHRLFIGILLMGYMAMLCSQALVVSNKEGKDSYFNTSLVQHIFKSNAAHASSKSIQSKNTKELHLRINRHFETGKLFCILPKSIEFTFFSTAFFKPLYYYSNHFVSSFLYVCVGRAPPVIA